MPMKICNEVFLSSKCAQYGPSRKHNVNLPILILLGYHVYEG